MYTCPVGARIIIGDCLETLRAMEPNTIDAVLTDPPYGLSAPPDVAEVLKAWTSGESYDHTGRGFMGQEWDSFVPGPEVWRECFRVMKPGAHLVCFAGTRTQDLMGISLRLGGFEIRDCGAWLYATGFPKSLSCSRAIDQHLGKLDDREVVGVSDSHREAQRSNETFPLRGERAGLITEPATDEARLWHAFGSALKPSHEPWILARKPLCGTYAENLIRWGVGGLNVDGCRYGYGDPAWFGPSEKEGGWSGAGSSLHEGGLSRVGGDPRPAEGRYPANSYVCAKASRAEREQGCEDLPARSGFEAVEREEGSKGLDNPRAGAGRTAGKVRNHHPTVKPLALMRWLARLIGCQPGSTILDPFVGSGTTTAAAILEGFEVIGCEIDPEFAAIAEARSTWAMGQARTEASQGDLFRERKDPPAGEVSKTQGDLFGTGA